MASSAAVLYARPYSVVTATSGRSSGAQMYVTPRTFAGLWSTSGVSASSDMSGLLAWLPGQRQPIGWVTINGQRMPVEIDAQAWYRFFLTVAEIKLGGIAGATIPDVATTVTQTQEQAATASTQTAQLAQVTEANAQATAALREVAINNGLSGSTQIPPAVTGVYENFP